MKIHPSWKRKCKCGHIKDNHKISWSGKMGECAVKNCNCYDWKILPKKVNK